jgi:quinol monooxygenase YgiN
MTPLSSSRALKYAQLTTFRDALFASWDKTKTGCRNSKNINPLELLQSRDDETKFILLRFFSALEDVQTSTSALAVIDSLQPGSSPLILSEETFQYIYPPRGHRAMTPKDFDGPVEDAANFCVFFDIKPIHIRDFQEGLLEECQLVEKLEAKSARFHLLQQVDNPSLWIVLEGFRDPTGLELHKNMPHYQKVRAALETWQRSPRSHDKGYRLHLL